MADASAVMSQMQRLEPLFVERIWGRYDLSPWFSQSDKCIGEVWYRVAEDHPLLIKFLFTSQKLSVQVHPDDHFAAQHERCRGKTEMWHILDTAPGASVALGLREPAEKHVLHREFSRDGAEELLEWLEPAVGDTYLIAPGTIHALGPGLVLCEVQQNSDITYRLYDYGRGRELHLAKGLDAAKPSQKGECCTLPLRCRYFETDLLIAEAATEISLAADTFLVCLAGSGQLAGQKFTAGEAFWTPNDATMIVEPNEPIRLLGVRTLPA